MLRKESRDVYDVFQWYNFYFSVKSLNKFDKIQVVDWQTPEMTKQ